jgi:hypothetical protein
MSVSNDNAKIMIDKYEIGIRVSLNTLFGRENSEKNL